MRLAIATHAMLLVVDLDETMQVVDRHVLNLGYHYGLALGSGGELISYRGGESVHTQDDLRLITYGLPDLGAATQDLLLGQPMGAVHQVAAANGGLYIANTLNNSVTFIDKEGDRTDYYVDGVDSDQSHVNSVYPTGREILVMLHNLFRKESEVLVLHHSAGGELVPQHRLSLWHRQCHNIFADATQLAYNASAARTFVVADLEADRLAAAIEFRQHSKGLAVTGDHFLVGLSEYASRDERSTSNGWVQVIDRSTFELVRRIDLAALDLPRAVGNINDIRIISGQELGHAAGQPLAVDWGSVLLARANPTQYFAARARTMLEYPIRRIKKRMRTAGDSK